MVGELARILNVESVLHQKLYNQLDIQLEKLSKPRKTGKTGISFITLSV